MPTISLNLKTPKQTLYKRKVKTRKPPLVSCFDLYSYGDRGRRDLCPNCINYLDLVPKTKPQSQMGIRNYGCHGPTSILEDDTSVATTEDIVDKVEVEVTPGQRCNHASTNGVTDNYVHMLRAGHIKYYFKKWRNLNRFINQGWEAYKKMVALFWHHRTTKGGSKVDRSRIRPIARWLLRLMTWKTGEGNRFFQERERNKVNTRDKDNALDVEESDDEGDSDDDVSRSCCNISLIMLIITSIELTLRFSVITC
jgi:hypothetical protein